MPRGGRPPAAPRGEPAAALEERTQPAAKSIRAPQTASATGRHEGRRVPRDVEVGEGSRALWWRRPLALQERRTTPAGRRTLGAVARRSRGALLSRCASISMVEPPVKGSSGQHLVEQECQGVEVGPPVHLAAERLLGRM